MLPAIVSGTEEPRVVNLSLQRKRQTQVFCIQREPSVPEQDLTLGVAPSQEREAVQCVAGWALSRDVLL